MIDNHAVAGVEAAHTGPFGHDDAAGLVPGDGAGDIALRPLADVLAVDAADVAAADGGGHGLDQNLAVAGGGNVKLFQLNGAVAGQNGAGHFAGDHIGYLLLK